MTKIFMICLWTVVKQVITLCRAYNSHSVQELWIPAEVGTKHLLSKLWKKLSRDFFFPGQIYKHCSKCPPLCTLHTLPWPRLLFFPFITYSSRVIARSPWHLWNDSTAKESVLHPLTRPQGLRERESLNVAVWAFGNSGQCLKKTKLPHCTCFGEAFQETGAGRTYKERRRVMKLLQPSPTPASFQGRMQCMARGAGLGGSWACLNSSSREQGGGERGTDFIFPRKRSQGKKGGYRQHASEARRSPYPSWILVPWTLRPYHPSQSRGGKRERKKEKGSRVTQSMCCSSHMCCLGLLNAVIRSVLAPNRSTITKQGPHLLSSPMCQETPRKSKGRKVGQDGNRDHRVSLPPHSFPHFFPFFFNWRASDSL